MAFVQWRSRVFLGVLCLLLSACARESVQSTCPSCSCPKSQIPQRQSTTPPILDPFARDFLLLDENGAPFNDLTPSQRPFPFGVLISVGLDKGMCTVSHVTEELVQTSAHCISKNDRYYYAFFRNNQTGKKDYVILEPDDVVYRGSFIGKDLALLRIPEEKQALWDVLGEDPSILNVDENRQSEAVSVWTFDNLEFHQDRWSHKSGAIFQKVDCQQGAKVQPAKIVEVQTADGMRKVLDLRFFGGTIEPNQYYFGECTGPLHEGNSGSLISLKDRPDQAIALFNRLFTVEWFRDYWNSNKKDALKALGLESLLPNLASLSSYRYEWTGGAKGPIDVSSDGFIFGVGSLLSKFEAKAPIKIVKWDRAHKSQPESVLPTSE